MKKKRIALCIALVCVCANAATWTGAGADGDWANSVNWADGSVPANDGTAIFKTAATLAPPATFTGTIMVTNAVVTVNIAEARAFSSAVYRDGKLVKAGAGELTLRAAPGPYTGEIAIDSGTVRFMGNGEYGAPGLFGKLTVAPGAAAIVAESPAATRHGAPVIAVDRNNTSIEVAPFRDQTGTFDKFRAVWDSIEVTNANQRVVLVPDASPALFENNLWLPPFYQWRDYFNAYARAVFVFPKAERLLIQHRSCFFSMAHVDGVQRFSGNQNTGIANFSLNAGWHTIDAALCENKSSENLNMILMANGLGDVSRFTSDVLWKGVCFNSLALAADASLTVENGHAVAFALGGEIDVKGSVAGGAGSVVAIASGAFNAPAAAFAGFAGSIEVMRLASADITELPANPAFRLSGRGRVGASMLPLLGPDFAGVVEVPAGVTYVNEFASGASFTGAGTLVTPSLTGLEKFTGTVKLTGAGDVAELDDAATAAQALTLANGASLNIGIDALSKVAVTTVADGIHEGDWTFNGTNNGSSEFTGNIAYMSNDVIVVTDDGGTQRNSAIYTNRTFTIADDCELSFVYRAEMLNRFSKERRGEGASFFFTDNPRGFSSSSQMAWPSDAYGFSIFQYGDTSSMGMTWIEAGQHLDMPNYSASAMGLNMHEPLNIMMRLRAGILYVTLEQEGKTFTASRNMTNGFRPNDKKYFGVGGGTAYWGTLASGQADVYCYQTISNFTARLRGGAYRDVEEGYLPITPETWRIKDSGVAVTNGGELAFAYQPPAKNVAFSGFAVCKKLFSTRRPFSITFNERMETASRNWGEGISIIFTPDGEKVSNDGRTFYCGRSKSVSFMHFFWENRFCWSHNNSVYSADQSSQNPGGIPQSLGTNNIRIDYDGRGTFTATVRRGNNVWTSVRTYSDVPEWGEEMAFGFMGATSTWGAYHPTFISDIGLFFSRNMPFDVPAVSVEAGATAALSVGNLEKTADEPSVNLPSVTLGAGARLNVEPELAHAARVAFGEVATAGAATLAATGNAIVELADVWPVDGPLTVAGAWAGTIVFHVDASRIGSGLVLANLNPALYAGDGEPVFEIVDKNGNSFGDKYVLTYKNGVLKVKPNGMVLFFR